MSKTKSPPTFSVGDTVRVKLRVRDPDFPDIPFGGWAGTISDTEQGEQPCYLIALNDQTLESIHPIYYKRCERDGLEPTEVWMLEDDLEPNGGGPDQIEQPTSIVSEPLSMDDQDDRIRSALSLTSNDPLPEADGESLGAYYKYLADNVSFPFEGKYSFETRPFESKTYSITVTGLLHSDGFTGDGYGIFCEARRGMERIELPLTEVEADKGNPNRRLLSDYSYWIVNW